MLDLLLNETLIRSLFPWLAATTPIVALAWFVLSGRGRSGETPTPNPTPTPSPHPVPSPGSAPLPSPTTETADVSPVRKRLLLLGLALSGPAVWLLWTVYESIMDTFGFASVRGLLIALAVFAALGLTVGALAGRRLAKAADNPPDGQ